MYSDSLSVFLLQHQGAVGTGAGGPAKVLETTRGLKLEPIGKGVNPYTVLD